VHRIGQRNAVNVILLISKDSMEERLEATLEAKRELFAATVGDDATTTEMKRPSLATRIATLLDGEFAAATGKDRAPATPAASYQVEELRARLGDALEKVVRLPDGRLLGVVRGEVAPPPAVDLPAVLLPSRAADALAPLGDSSPLVRGEVLYQADAPPAVAPNLALAATSWLWPSASSPPGVRWPTRGWEGGARPPARRSRARMPRSR
jgi:hypothetical protein